MIQEVLNEKLRQETLHLAQSIIQFSFYQRRSNSAYVLEFTIEKLRSIITEAIKISTEKNDLKANIPIRTDHYPASYHDKNIVVKFNQLVEKNIENESFNVDIICKEFCMSRTSFYNKIKHLTGKSVGELIRNIRLKKAAYLLANEDLSVFEVMFKVGIKSQSYFTRFFKKEYGISPGQYARIKRRSPFLT